jgi:uncharacterized protein (DUF433 family)
VSLILERQSEVKKGMEDWRERISVDPNVCHGAPCIKGTRIMVWVILSCLANGDSIEDILAAYPNLTREDVYAALAYAAEMARERNAIRRFDNHPDIGNACWSV